MLRLKKFLSGVTEEISTGEYTSNPLFSSECFLSAKLLTSSEYLELVAYFDNFYGGSIDRKRK